MCYFPFCLSLSFTSYIFPFFFPFLLSLFLPLIHPVRRPTIYSGSLQRPFSLLLPRAGFTFPLDHPFEKTLGGLHNTTQPTSTAVICLIFAADKLYSGRSPYLCSRYRAGFTFPLDHPFEKTLRGAHRNSHRDPTA